MNRRPVILMNVLVLMQALSVGASAEMTIPLPKDAGRLREPQQVQMGRSALQVQSFTTRMSLEAVGRFYEEALPKSGWRLSPLPWQAQQLDVAARLEKDLRDHPGDTADPKLQGLRQQFRETGQAMRRQLHASKGAEHVVLHLMPLGDQTVVFINRWTGESVLTASAAKPVGQGVLLPPVGGLPSTNVCCSGAEVPNSQGTLPYGIPRYPNARVVAKSTPSDGQGVTLLLMTPDAPESVVAFYRKEMAYNGWKPLDLQTQEQLGSALGGAGTRLLVYRNATLLCGLTIGGSDGTTASGGAGETPMTIMVAPRPLSFKGNAQ